MPTIIKQSSKSNPIELCIATYQRYYRLADIVKKLNKQTNQDFNLNIWNNSGKDITPFVKDFPQDRLTIIQSEKNEGSAARFKLVPYTKGECIIFFDDDEDVVERFVEYNFKEYQRFGKDVILGWYTRTFLGKGYGDSFDNATYGSEVDYIGTGGMVLDRWIFDTEDTLLNIPEPYDKVEDLYLCYIARMKYAMHLIKINKSVEILVDGKDQFVNIDKEDIFLRLKSLGWRLIKNMYLEEVAYNNLKDFQEVMNKLNIPFWLSEGLLLGLHRDGGIILGDEDDIDVCLWKEFSERSDEILNALKEKGFEVLNDWKFEGSSEGIAVYRDGSKIDIIFTRKKENEVFFLARNLSGNMGKMPYFAFVFPAHLFDEFGEIKWKELTLPCPKNVDEFLTSRYGNWKVRKLRGIDYNPDSFEDNPCYRTDWDYAK
jgi:phosphorylcholine metabolism protein LicD